MEVEKVIHMKEGLGECSYARNSIVQRAVIEKVRPVLEESVRDLYHDLSPECLMVADMGCSSGPNSLLAVSQIIDIVNDACRSLKRQTPKFGVFLNDLPCNDFNTVFKFLPSFYKELEEEKGKDFGPCFVSGTARSFYGRVFPDQFLHFVHSSYSLHWLSQVPEGLVTENGVALNKINIYIAKASPPEVWKAYYTQFRRDFTVFLSSRAKEMVPNGRMILTFVGSINSTDPESLVELLGCTLHTMVLEELVEQEKLERFNEPLYLPTVEEVRHLVHEEASFVLNKIETFPIDWSADTNKTVDDRAKIVADSIRAVGDAIITNAFGFDEETMDNLFIRFKENVKKRMVIGKETTEYLNIVVSMTKKA